VCIQNCFYSDWSPETHKDGFMIVTAIAFFFLKLKTLILAVSGREKLFSGCYASLIHRFKNLRH
jgi:hypothetical protein